MFRKSTLPKIQITCPHCDHVQLEPEYVISTICRKCNSGISVQEGHSVKRPQKVTMSHPTPTPPAAEWDIRAPKPPSFWKRFFQSAELNHLNHRNQVFSSSKNNIDPVKLIPVHCPHCHKSQNVRPTRGSAHCLQCGHYLLLQDYQIDADWQKRIQTCGNVHITKNAHVHGNHISCHDLLCEGAFQASASCTGEVRFRNSAKIVGTLQCRELEIEESHVIESLSAIHTHSALIMGRLHGSIIATGGVTIEKNATVIGNITAANILIKPGAKHQGSIQIDNPKNR